MPKPLNGRRAGAHRLRPARAVARREGSWPASRSALSSARPARYLVDRGFLASLTMSETPEGAQSTLTGMMTVVVSENSYHAVENLPPPTIDLAPDRPRTDSF
jgi:hypothetical protein